jgi:hypothetical protein
MQNNWSPDLAIGDRNRLDLILLKAGAMNPVAPNGKSVQIRHCPRNGDRAQADLHATASYRF